MCFNPTLVWFLSTLQARCWSHRILLFQSHLGLISFNICEVAMPCLDEFQSHLGLISFGKLAWEVASKKKCFNPTLVWFLSLTSTLLSALWCQFQSHLGLISFLVAVLLLFSLIVFQSHLGLISFIVWVWKRFTNRPGFNPTLVWFLSRTSSQARTQARRDRFQSHLGLISFDELVPPLLLPLKVSIPPWSDFFRKTHAEPLPSPHVSIPPWSDFFRVGHRRW